MQQPISLLQKFSFSEPESKIYLSCLKLKKATVSEIAKKTEIGRTNAYFHIKNLVEKNILKESKKGTKIYISPTKPSDLAEELQKNVSVFKELVPQLESLNKAEQEIPQIEILESKKGFYKIYDEITDMPKDSEFKVIENKKTAQAELTLIPNEQWKKFFTKIVEKNILTNALFTKEMLEDIEKNITPQNYELISKRLWRIHSLPEKSLPVNNLILIYSDKVAFLTPDNMLAIIIKHKSVTNILSALFDTIFNLTEPAKAPWSKI